MLPLSMRSFSTELIKLALEIKDPDIRALQADRKGKEYLQGGRLPANTESETSFVPKLAGYQMGYSRMGRIGMRGPDETPAPQSGYDKMKDYGLTGMKGALTGAGVTGLGGALYKHEFKPTSNKLLRAGAGVGAAAAIADKLYTRHQQNKQKVAMMGSQTFTPARDLQASSETGGFESKVVHKGPGLKPSGLVGRAGLLPRV